MLFYGEHFYRFSVSVNKIYHLFARIPYNSYFGESTKRWSQWFQGKRIVGFHFSKFGCSKPTLPKNNPSRVFFGEFGKFSQNRHKKNNSTWIAQNILSKEVKQLLQRRGGGTGIAMKLLKKTKWTISKISRYFRNILSEFCVNGLSMDRYQIRWLLSSGKVVEV